MIKEITRRISSFTEQNEELSFLQLFVEISKAGINMLLAKWYLRKCDYLAAWVSVNGRPVVENQGQILISSKVRIWSNIIKSRLYTGKNGIIEIGENSRINGTHIDAQNKITIGENCRIAPYTVIIDSDFHDLNNHFVNVKGRPIVIEDDVWITTRVTILKGVTIGKGSVVATGAVVTKDVEPYTVVGGIPARKIKKINKT